MAIKLERTIRRFLGKSYETKPTIGVQVADGSSDEIITLSASDLPLGSTFFEEDTGDIWRWNGTAWMLPAPDEDLQRLLVKELRCLRRELIALRLGMIEAGECNEPSWSDVDHELQATAY